MYFPQCALYQQKQQRQGGTCINVLQWKTENRCISRFFGSWTQADYQRGAGTLEADYSSRVGSNLGPQSDQTTIAPQTDGGKEASMVKETLERRKKTETDGKTDEWNDVGAGEEEWDRCRARELKCSKDEKIKIDKAQQRERERKEKEEQQPKATIPPLALLFPSLCSAGTLFLSHLYSHQLWG